MIKRFWREVTVEGGAIRLDGRAVRTPARAELVLPNAALAGAVAAEWRAVADEVDPRAMPLTGLSNAAIDRADAALADSVAAYAQGDVLCYRADDAELAAEEAAAWDPLLAWARGRYDVAFTVTTGIAPVAQPEATVARLGAVVRALEPFALAGFQPLVRIGGSLVTALAVVEGEIAADAAFDATHLDELWQARRWGEDALATAARAARRGDFLSAASFLRLLRARTSAA